jgi:hypothetical protein
LIREGEIPLPFLLARVVVAGSVCDIFVEALGSQSRFSSERG